MDMFLRSRHKRRQPTAAEEVEMEKKRQKTLADRKKKLASSLIKGSEVVAAADKAMSGPCEKEGPCWQLVFKDLRDVTFRLTPQFLNLAEATQEQHAAVAKLKEEKIRVQNAYKTWVDSTTTKESSE